MDDPVWMVPVRMALPRKRVVRSQNAVRSIIEISARTTSPRCFQQPHQRRNLTIASGPVPPHYGGRLSAAGEQSGFSAAAGSGIRQHRSDLARPHPMPASEAQLGHKEYTWRIRLVERV